MSARLVPCGGCGRHVMSVETDCPFCGEAVDVAQAAPARPTRRLNRAATWAFGAAVAASAAVGCGESHDTDGGVEADSGTEVDSGNIAQPYGAPPADAGEPDAGTDAGEEEDAGNIAPPYGAPVQDAGFVDEDAGFAPLYGGAPED